MNFLLLLVICWVQMCGGNVQSLDAIDPHKSIVYGPGIKMHLTYPARYFFIQAVNKDNKNLTYAPDDTFTVKIDGSESRCRIWTQTLNLHDGSFIVRYKLYETCSKLTIRILYNNEDVAKSPYTSEAPTYDEECYCPEKKMNEWLQDMECPDTYSQIEDDLKIFKKVNMKEAVQEAKIRFNHPKSESVCHYAIINNEVFRQCLGEYVGFKMFIDAIVLSLARKVELPDVEFIVNLGDWPLEKRTETENPLPIFSWCKSDSVRDILMPTYDITQATLETMGRVMLDMMSAQQNSGVLWASKTSKAIWRGRDSRRERLQLISLARKHPQLIDAALTNFFFFREEMEDYGPRVEHMSFFDFFKYKYQINIDGTVAAYRFPFLLAGGSLVVKQKSDYYEHFYKELAPMVHYVPFERNLSDLVEKLEWAVSNDKEAEKIALQGKRFAQENLMPRDIFCYHAVLLKKFSERLVNTPTVDDAMEKVPQPGNSCDCHKLQQSKLLKTEL